MKIQRAKWMIALVLLCVGAGLILWNLSDSGQGSGNAESQETQIKADELPPAVLATVQRESAGGTVQEIEKEVEGDTTTYEIDIIKGSSRIELDIAEDGSIVEYDIQR